MDNHSEDNTCATSQVDLPGVRETYVKGMHELHTCKVHVLDLKRGKVTDKFRFRFREDQILSVKEKPVNSQGKVFACSLKNTDSIKASSADLGGSAGMLFLH